MGGFREKSESGYRIAMLNLLMVNNESAWTIKREFVCRNMDENLKQSPTRPSNVARANCT